MADEERFELLAAEWADLEAAERAVGKAATVATLERWDGELDAMVREESQLRANGLWRSGGRTLLRAMRLHHSEVHLCAGLAWLLTPDGWHGLGSTFLSDFLTQVGVTDVEQRALDSATIVTEEYRVADRSDDVASNPTRADIVVRVPLARVCVVVEAKVWAAEQPQQCQRLAELWEEESPTLVFLTRSGHAPTTSRPDDEWRLLTWQSVASLLSAAIGRTNPRPGVRDFQETIEEYGGRPA